MPPLPHQLPPQFRSILASKQAEITRSLAEFAAVPPEQWFYELCYCILTPQSRAVHADAVVQQLTQLDFQHAPQDVLALLRNPDHYIRFHNVKHARLHAVQAQWTFLSALIENGLQSPLQIRKDLVEAVNGFGFKEASHFLRNIGVGGLTILDRHILKCLAECGVIDAEDRCGSTKQYLEIEKKMMGYADQLGISVDDLDLVFWSSKTGEVRK
ncbi:MAG: DNA lyase [Ignavibacteria bacterium]|nr:DNA lyase [Ignavibacteria bacterium]